MCDMLVNPTNGHSLSVSKEGQYVLFVEGSRYIATRNPVLNTGVARGVQSSTNVHDLLPLEIRPEQEWLDFLTSKVMIFQPMIPSL